MVWDENIPKSVTSTKEKKVKGDERTVDEVSTIVISKRNR